MKALSLLDNQEAPWATLIALGIKTIETRTWNTSHRGDVLICVSKRSRSPFAGKAICIVSIDDCIEMTSEHEQGACVPVFDRAKSWMISKVRLIKPFDVKGQQRLFDVDVPDDISTAPGFIHSKIDISRKTISLPFSFQANAVQSAFVDQLRTQYNIQKTL